MGIRGSTLPCNRRGVNGGDACALPVEGRGAIWRDMRRRKPVMTARPDVNVEQRLVRKGREGRTGKRKKGCVSAQTGIHALLSFALKTFFADKKSPQKKSSTRSGLVWFAINWLKKFPMHFGSRPGERRVKAGCLRGMPRAGLNARNLLRAGTEGHSRAVATVRPIKLVRHAARSVERPAAMPTGSRQRRIRVKRRGNYSTK